MHKITFYRQKRRDGGVRSAITIDELTALHHFEEGEGPSDPALEWYVDIRCEGNRLPTTPEKARQWFLDHAEVVRRGLTQLAEELEGGLDAGSWPLQWPLPSPPRGVRMFIVLTAVRRWTLLDIASILLEIRDQWKSIIQELSVLASASP